ncbi:MAG: exodeoxyribonuclease VII small subunit [Gammaproteobacteria bacterium]|nr:exodeoxyribonuclease VII small subunit [Gammaproteobacteria bacterium]
MSASKEAATEGPDFEAALEELEALVERMEGGELSLDESLAAFERGIHLTRRCQQALSEAEQRVAVLLEKDDGSLTTETAPPNPDPSP